MTLNRDGKREYIGVLPPGPAPSEGDWFSRLAGQPVRFRFHLTNGRLYAFWVSPAATGASHGYVAAGGPGFLGPTDTLGIAAYPRGRGIEKR